MKTLIKIREVEGSDKRIVEILKWSGITWDEGIGSIYDKITEGKSTGPCEPYYQSHRLKIYNKWIQHLLDKRQAYHWFWTSDRLNDLK